MAGEAPCCGGPEGEHRLQIIGVLDLLGGRAVHARAGARDRYAPVQHAAGQQIEPGNPMALATIYIDALGISQVYVADLDAILYGRPQDELTASLASLHAPLWVDAGLRSVGDARRAIAAGASRAIVGLETLPSLAVLAGICDAVGAGRVAFSLDLRDGRPIVADGAGLGDRSPEEIAGLAAMSGADTLIVIDLARVGTNRGLDDEVLKRVHGAAPHMDIVAGGGIRGWDDLVRAAEAGCSAALVATALHDGRVGASEIVKAQRL